MAGVVPTLGTALIISEEDPARPASVHGGLERGISSYSSRHHHTVHGATHFAPSSSVSLRSPSSGLHHRAPSSNGQLSSPPVPSTSLYAPRQLVSEALVPDHTPAPSSAQRALEQTLLIIPGTHGNSSHHHASTHGGGTVRRGMTGSLHGVSAYQRAISGLGTTAPQPTDTASINTPVAGLNTLDSSDPAKTTDANGVVVDLDMTQGVTLSKLHLYASDSARAWVINYFKKWQGVPGQHPPPMDSWHHMFWTYVGSFVSIMAIALIHQRVSPNINLPLLVASFGASAVLLFGVPDGKLSQPRNFIGGHLVSSLIGVGLRNAFDEGLVWVSAPLGMATALLAMQITRTTHPPGGASALIAASVVQIGPWFGFKFILTILFACAVMLMVALVVNNISSHRRYPMYWW